MAESASEHAVRAANPAIQAFEGDGRVHEYPVRTYMRDARVVTLDLGAARVQQLPPRHAETGRTTFV